MLQQLKGHWMRKDPGLALNSTWGHGATDMHLPSSPGRQDVVGSNCWQQHGVGGRLQAQTQSSLGGFSSHLGADQPFQLPQLLGSIPAGLSSSK